MDDFHDVDGFSQDEADTALSLALGAVMLLLMALGMGAWWFFSNAESHLNFFLK